MANLTRDPPLPLLRNTAAPASQGERDLIAGSEVAGKRGGRARILKMPTVSVAVQTARLSVSAPFDGNRGLRIAPASEVSVASQTDPPTVPMRCRPEPPGV
jgi:hypothetical protein